jgi:hypothetical protein
VLDDVHGERGFPHRRAGGDDEHFTALQAAAHAVELAVAGGQAAELAGVLQHVLDAVDGIHDVRLSVLDALFGAHVFAHGEHALLGMVDDGVDVVVQLLFAVLVGVVDVQRTGMDQFTENVLLHHDLFIEREVRRDRDEGEKLRDRCGTADFVEEVLLTQSVGQRDGIDWQVFVKNSSSFS